MSNMELGYQATIFLVLFLGCILQTEAAYDEKAYKKIVLGDNSNDGAINLDAQHLLERSGFDYEEYNVLADDGYITQLVRIINPLADRTRLKRPPIMLYHGSTVDMTCFLIASSIQHHPEKYPRTDTDGPMTSSNRSLGFTLANHGYDVWLMGRRGSNRANMNHLRDSLGRKIVATDNFEGKNLTQGEIEYIYERTPFYWQYGQDEEIAFDVKNQIDTVLNHTGSKEYFLFAYSLAAPTTLAFLAMRPDYAKNCRAYIQFGPAIEASHVTSLFDKLYFEGICTKLPTFGLGFTPSYIAEPLVRKLVVKASASPATRYGLIRKLLNLAFGPSPIYNTNLELNVLNHLFLPVSFKTVQQYCQNSVAKKTRKFDFGKKKNLLIYGQPEPPEYFISRIEVQNYILIYGTGDGLADLATIEHIKDTVSSPTPVVEIVAPMFNHLDLIAGVETGLYINLPLIKSLDRHVD